MNRVKEINNLGQSIWLDFFDREIMDNGSLQQLIDVDGLSGITSNPSIFEKAITSSADYDEDIAQHGSSQMNNIDLFFNLAVHDIQRAADILKPIFDKTNGRDGYVSIEVSPYLAHDTEGTVQQAKQLWNQVNRKNVMIKIPSTAEGLPAIRRCIAAGINVNITLLFGLERYREVTDAYLAGLEDRVNANLPISPIASVASFFLSRIDVLLDPILASSDGSSIKGKVAIASAKLAYSIYKEVFGSQRFKKLEAAGAHTQKVLWASTGTKNPAYSDVKYVESLIGPDTINTLPLNTIDAFRDHGIARPSIEENIEDAKNTLEVLKEKGILLNEITQKLEDEGIVKFNKAFDQLLQAIESKRKKAG